MKKQPKISYHKKPLDLSMDEWQRFLRKQFIQDKKQQFIITYLDGEHPIFSDYSVKNPQSQGVYKIALRSSNPGPNFCTCMDFKTNTLGTCKHIEAILEEIKKNKKLSRLLIKDYKPSYSSLFLKYGNTRQVMMRVGTQHTKEYQDLAASYFDDSNHLLPAAYTSIDQFLKKAIRISPDFRCYPDAMDFILTVRENQKRTKLIQHKIKNLKDKYFDNLLKATLYPYQREGILFAALAGRSLIADEMGLGKTIQALGTIELFKKELGIHNVLIVTPTSLKYQWKNEIKKFTDNNAIVIEGNAISRQKQYETDNFYKIVNYNVIGTDIDFINKQEVDFVILDEAQRIKNWKTQIAKHVKKIKSKYAIVLTGTPIENKLEELYSIIQFLDPFRLGPLYKFLSSHQIQDESGKVTGYKNLNSIHKLLSDIVLRRTKKEVLQQLPKRTDKHLFVPLTSEQEQIHTEYKDITARLVNKWKRMGFLDEKDRQRLLSSLNCMRMVSDSTFILDQKTRFDTKITELMSILDNIFLSGAEKTVVFSQWERMTRLVKTELENRKIGYSYLHGGIPSHKREHLVDDFHNNPLSRVFLSTDAGGVGLNLQCASVVVNLDIPWNPAVLEQRIGRVHRHGQKQNVSVINFVSRQSIEERMLDVLKFKSSLFAGVLDNGSDQIFMGESRFKSFMRSVEKITNGEEKLQPETIPQAAGAQLFTIEKDALTGKSYLKIPIENQEVIMQGVNALQQFLKIAQNYKQ